MSVVIQNPRWQRYMLWATSAMHGRCHLREMRCVIETAKFEVQQRQHWLSMILTVVMGPNKIGRTNRRTAFPFEARRQFENSPLVLHFPCQRRSLTSG